MRRFGGRVEFACDRETAFDYLVDPRRRPEWQSSLRRVSEVDGEPRVGQTWVDETKPGLKPTDADHRAGPAGALEPSPAPGGSSAPT